MNFCNVNKEELRQNIGQFVKLIKDWKYSLWSEDNFLYELPKKWDYSFALYEEKELLGFCIASGKIEEVYYIHLFFLSDKARGKAFGKAMIEQAQKVAQRNGINRIELRCPESNTGALEFYHKAGFKTVQIIKDEVSGPEADHYLAINF